MELTHTSVAYAETFLITKLALTEAEVARLTAENARLRDELAASQREMPGADADESATAG